MAVIEYDDYKQKLLALEPTLGELEKALGRETAARIVRNGDELFHDHELDAVSLHQPKKFLGMWV